MLSDVARALKRLSEEYNQFVTPRPYGIVASPYSEDDLFTWWALIPGPDGTPFENAVLDAELKFPKDYPFSPPTMRFLSEVWHPNVHYKNGEKGIVCISILHPPGDDPNHYEDASERWTASLSLESILISVMSLLADPNDESPANVEAAKQWRENRVEYEKRIRRDMLRNLGLPVGLPAKS